MAEARPVRSSIEAAFRDNGFYVFRGLIPRADCAAIAARIRSEAPPEKLGRSVPDAVNKYAWLVDVMARPDLLGAVKRVGLTDPKFLQVADIQLDHNRDNWHRDSSVRTFGGADWDESEAAYRVVKAIIYLEIDRAGLAVVPGTHVMGSKAGYVEDKLANYLHIEPGVMVAEKTYASAPDRRTFIEMSVGDVLVFDERLVHCGRRLGEDRSEFSEGFAGAKTTLAFVYGDPNLHSWRFHSYFRHFRKDLRFAPLSAETEAAIAAHGLLPEFQNVYIGDVHASEPANFQR